MLRPFVAKTGGNQGMSETRVSDLLIQRTRGKMSILKDIPSTASVRVATSGLECHDETELGPSPQVKCRGKFRILFEYAEGDPLLRGIFRRF